MPIPEVSEEFGDDGQLSIQPFVVLPAFGNAGAVDLASRVWAQDRVVVEAHTSDSLICPMSTALVVALQVALSPELLEWRTEGTTAWADSGPQVSANLPASLLVFEGDLQWIDEMCSRREQSPVLQASL